jgi:hypothetical protein
MTVILIVRDAPISDSGVLFMHVMEDLAGKHERVFIDILFGKASDKPRPKMKTSDQASGRAA